MNREELLYLEKRNNIYHLIKNYPGLHLRGISRKLDTPKTTLLYHIRYLLRENLIFVNKEGRFSRYYIRTNVGKEDKIIFNLMRQEIPRKLLLFIFLYPENNISDICQELDLKPSTINYYIRKLFDLNIIERNKIGKTYVYRLKNQKQVFNFLITYETSIDDEILIPFLEWVKYIIPHGTPSAYNKKKKVVIDVIYNNMLEIFPHPYHV